MHDVILEHPLLTSPRIGPQMGNRRTRRIETKSVVGVKAIAATDRDRYARINRRHLRGPVITNREAVSDHRKIRV